MVTVPSFVVPIVPIVDCHAHVFDPARFPYRADTFYRPAGQELATFGQLEAVMGAYGVRHVLLVGPNSGYANDNRCLIDAIARSAGRCKGMAVVEREASTAELAALQAQGIVGIAFNPTLLGVDYYLAARDLVSRIADLGLFLQLQVEKDQLVDLMPLIERTTAHIVIDHCGRPDPAGGLQQAGFQALLALGRSGRATVKLSGYSKLSREAYPWSDGWPYVRALVEAFTLDNCVWGSDWPFLRAPERVDYGPLLTLVARLFPDEADRRKLLWETPRRVFGFGAGA
jgi:predicted TIM-barrel fold metal-dependent hydrolase